MPTAAVVIIGNEILSGKFADENGPYLIRRLRDLGADLRRLVTIADDPATIAAEVRACSAQFDVVLTTGGVGPTHDDVTLPSIAAAFGVGLVVEPTLVQLMERFSMPVDETTIRMATVPVGAELLRSAVSSYPVLKVHNVYVFPGVPKLFQVKFEAIAERFAGAEIHTARLYSAEYETAIAGRLAEAQSAHSGVEIGSYPRFGEGEYKVIVTLESRDPRAIAACEADLRASLTLLEP